MEINFENVKYSNSILVYPLRIVSVESYFILKLVKVNILVTVNFSNRKKINYELWTWHDFALGGRL